MKYRRILLKLSGEALMGGGNYGIDPATLAEIADEVIDVHGLGVEIAMVIGGGNIFRGVAGSASGMDRASADYMGMLATLINALILFYALSALRRAELGLKYQYDRSEALVGAVMPSPIAERLKAGEERIADRIETLTVMFSDLVGYTESVRRLPPEEVVDFLDRLVRIFDGLSAKYGVEKIKTIGDAYMAAAGIDGRGKEGAIAAGRMAPKHSPCALPICSQSWMLTTYMRVRTTWASVAPAWVRAASIVRRAWTVCAYGSPAPTIPAGVMAVVPATCTYGPTRTAREYPTRDSQGPPLVMFRRCTIGVLLMTAL